MPLQLALSPEFQRTKAPERSNSLKILFWRFRDSANLPRTLSPTSSPVAGAALLKQTAVHCRTQFSSRISRQPQAPLLTHFYSSRQLNLAWNSRVKLAKPHKHWRFHRKKNLRKFPRFARDCNSLGHISPDSHKTSTPSLGAFIDSAENPRFTGCLHPPRLFLARGRVEGIPPEV